MLLSNSVGITIWIDQIVNETTIACSAWTFLILERLASELEVLHFDGSDQLWWDFERLELLKAFSSSLVCLKFAAKSGKSVVNVHNIDASRLSAI